MLEKIVEKSKKVVGYQVELDMKQSDFNFVEDAYAFFAKVVEMWSLLNEWERDHGNWVSTPVLDLNAQEIKAKASATKKRMSKLFDLFKEAKPPLRQVALACINSMTQFEVNYLDLMTTLRHESFKERHWRDLLLEIAKGKEPPKLETLTFKSLIEMNIKSHKSFITILSEKANNQYIVEFKIDEIERSLCNTQVQVKGVEKTGQAVITNEQQVRGSLAEHRELLHEMLRSSEHLETFLEQIYRVVLRIDKLEEAFDQLLEIQELLSHLKVARYSQVLAYELGRKEMNNLDFLFAKYGNLFDDMKSRGLAQVMRLIVEKEERLSESAGLQEAASSQTLPSGDPASLVKGDDHEENLAYLRSAYSKLRSCLVKVCSATPRLVHLTPEKLCDIICQSHHSKSIRLFDACFPEIRRFGYSPEDPLKVVAFAAYNGELLALEKPIFTGAVLGVDTVDLLKQVVAESETQIRKSVKAYLLKCLNYFLQNAYNFEKFLPFILDQGIPVALAETALRTVVQQDLSLMLDNCFIQSARDTHTARLQKYLNMITSPLRKISLLTYREAVTEGSREKLSTVEGFISVLVYLSEQVGEVVQGGEFDFGSFFWQSKVKHLLTVPRDKASEDLNKQTAMETYLKQIDYSLKELDIFSNLFYLAIGTRYLNNFELNLAVLNKLIPFGYQPTSDPLRPLFLPSSEKCIVSLALAVSQEKLLAIRGQDSSGKSTAVRHLARLAGRFLLVLDCSLFGDGEHYLRGVMSAAGCSQWVMLRNLHGADEAVLSQVAKIVSVLKKHFDSSEKKQVTVDGVDFYLAPSYCVFWPQSSHVFGAKEGAARIPAFLLAQFRPVSFITCDLYAFIHAHLLELTFIEEYDLKLIQSLSRSLLLFFQQLQFGLTDKSFMTTCLNREFEVSVEALLTGQQSAWKLSLASIRPVLKKVVHFLRMDQTSKSTVNKTIYKAVYSVLKYQLSSQQKDAMGLAFLATFDPSADLFTVVDSAYLQDAFSIYSFFAINKIPSFSNVGLIEKVNCLADTAHSPQCKAYLNFGNQLQIYADTFNRLLLFSLSKRLDCVTATGFYFNLSYLDRDDLVGGESSGRGLLSDFFSVASSGVVATPEFWLPPDCKKYWYALW